MATNAALLNVMLESEEETNQVENAAHPTMESIRIDRLVDLDKGPLGVPLSWSFTVAIVCFLFLNCCGGSRGAVSILNTVSILPSSTVSTLKNINPESNERGGG